MEYEDLILEKKDGIATITLNAPDKANAFTDNIKRNLPLAVHDIAKDDSVRVVVVTGAGKHFCAGGDLDWMKSQMNGTLKKTRYSKLARIGFPSELFPGLDKPVIAAINGGCIGLGFAMALSCDIRIASETARFACSFITRGLIPDSGMTYYLPRTVGLSKALELMFTGEIFDAAEAKSLGIVSHVVPPDQLLNSANELAKRIVQQPPIALELTKRLVYKSILANINKHLDWETDAQRICFGTKDHQESVLAFLGKRPPPSFTGE